MAVMTKAINPIRALRGGFWGGVKDVFGWSTWSMPMASNSPGAAVARSISRLGRGSKFDTRGLSRFGGRATNWITAGDLAGHDWRRGGAIAARSISALTAGKAVGDFLNPFGFGWGD